MYTKGQAQPHLQPVSDGVWPGARHKRPLCLASRHVCCITLPPHWLRCNHLAVGLSRLPIGAHL